MYLPGEPKPLEGLDNMWELLNAETAAIRDYVEHRSGNDWPQQAVKVLCETVSRFQVLYRIVAHGIPVGERERFQTTCVRLNKLAPQHFPFLAQWPAVKLIVDEAGVVPTTFVTGPNPCPGRAGYLGEVMMLLPKLYGFLQGDGQVTECAWCGRLMEKRRIDHRFCSALCRQHSSEHGQAEEAPRDEVPAAS